MFPKNNVTQAKSWKGNLLAMKAEKDAKDAEFKRRLESGEMYKDMVSEAVGFVTDSVTRETHRPYTINEAKDGIVTISISGALVITPGVRLYTAALYVPTNPKTDKNYFFDPYQFKDEEQVKQFFADVKAQLPAEVTFEEREARSYECHDKGGRAYDVRVEINLND